MISRVRLPPKATLAHASPCPATATDAYAFAQEFEVTAFPFMALMVQGDGSNLALVERIEGRWPVASSRAGTSPAGHARPTPHAPHRPGAGEQLARGGLTGDGKCAVRAGRACRAAGGARARPAAAAGAGGRVPRGYAAGRGAGARRAGTPAPWIAYHGTQAARREAERREAERQAREEEEAKQRAEEEERVRGRPPSIARCLIALRHRRHRHRGRLRTRSGSEKRRLRAFHRNPLPGRTQCGSGSTCLPAGG